MHSFSFFSSPSTVFLTTLFGGLVIWLGVKKDLFSLRLAGLSLQLLSFYIFAALLWYPFNGELFRNVYFISAILSSLVAFSSVYLLDNELAGSTGLKDRLCAAVLFLLGIVTWYAGCLREVYAHIVVSESLSGILLVVSATSILTGLVGEYIRWEKINYLLLLQLPIMVVVLLYETLILGGEYTMLSGWGTTVWPITFFIQYRILAVFGDLDWKLWARYYHLFTFWLLLYFTSRELGIRAQAEQLPLALTPPVIQLIFSLTVIFLLLFMGKLRLWPVHLFPRIYLFGGVLGIFSIIFFTFIFGS